MTEEAGGTRPKPTAELKSPWGRHVRAYMESYGVGYREAQKLAKESYKSPSAKPKAAPRAKAPKAPPKPKKPKAAPKPKALKAEKKESKTDHLQPWRAHVAEYRTENPKTSLKEALKVAKDTYRTPSKSTLVASPKVKRDEYDVSYEEMEEKKQKPVKVKEGKKQKPAKTKKEEETYSDWKDEAYGDWKDKAYTPLIWKGRGARSVHCGCGRRKCNCASAACEGCDQC